jgi:AraC-like DNA-binding protein
VSSEPTDPLADVLELLRPEAVLAAELHAHGRWSLAFDTYPHVKFGTVVEGECVVAVRGRLPKTFRTGDVYLLANPPPYVLASDLETPSQPASAVFRSTKNGIARAGQARAKPRTRLVGGHFVLDPHNAHQLVNALPALVSIPSDHAGPLRDVMRLLVREVEGTQFGRTRALAQLAQLALTYALRWLEADGQGRRTGWLRALADPHIGRSLRHIHGNVKAGPNLTELARVAGMSRTAFAERFKTLVGTPPHAYAIQWRMSLAKDALRTTDRAIGELAFELGYESESAFSMAFRRVIGCSPKAYRKGPSEPL